MYRNVSTVLTLIAFSLSLGACDSHSDDELDAELSEQDLIVENLLQVGYPDAEIEVREDGTVYVGHDAHVTLDASYEMVAELELESEQDEDGFRQYRTNNLVTDNNGRTINIVGQPSLDQTTKDALVAAVAEYNAMGLDLKFTVRFAATTGDITVYPEGSYAGGHAGFPSGGNPYPYAYIGGGTSAYGLNVVKHVVKHELGHCLGMRHSDFYNRAISCGSGGNEGDAGYGANHIPGTPTTAWADGSVMNSCFHGGSNGAWTAGDLTAFDVLYDSTPAKWTPAWCAHAGATLYDGDFDGDGNLDLLCHDIHGTSWLDYASNGIHGEDWVAGGWCGHAGSQFGVGDFDGDGRDDFYCHDTNGSSWIDYASNGFGGTDWHIANGWCGHAGAIFSVGNVNGDSRDDFICQNPGASYTWFDYGSDGFGATNWEG